VHARTAPDKSVSVPGNSVLAIMMTRWTLCLRAQHGFARDVLTRTTAERRHAAIIALLLLAACAAPAAHAVEVTIYGAGLKSCSAYRDAREKSLADEVPFVDWLSGAVATARIAHARSRRLSGRSVMSDEWRRRAQDERQRACATGR